MTSARGEERVRLFVALELPVGVRDALVDWRTQVLAADLGRVEPGRAGRGGLDPGRSEPGRPGPGRSEPGRPGPGRSEPGRRGPGRSALLRTVPPESMHVTLCFLGWQWAGDVAAIAAACEAVSSFGAAHLVVSKALWLPTRRPRVLTVSLSDDSGRLAEVQSLLSDQLSAGGWYVPEKRPFLAHVTVARVGKGGRVGRDARADLPEPTPVAFEGANVTLYQSRLSSRGARYVALATVALAG